MFVSQPQTGSDPKASGYTSKGANKRDDVEGRLKELSAKEKRILDKPGSPFQVQRLSSEQNTFSCAHLSWVE